MSVAQVRAARRRLIQAHRTKAEVRLARLMRIKLVKGGKK